MQGGLSAAGFPEEPHIGQHKQGRQTVHSIRRLAQQQHRGGEEELRPYVPEDGLAGGAHQRVAEGLAVGVVQILNGPAPRLGLVQEAVLPIVQPLKIQPGARSEHKADTEEEKEEDEEERRLGQQGSTGDGQREAGAEGRGGEGGYHINCHEAA